MGDMDQIGPIVGAGLSIVALGAVASVSRDLLSQTRNNAKYSKNRVKRGPSRISVVEKILRK